MHETCAHLHMFDTSHMFCDYSNACIQAVCFKHVVSQFSKVVVKLIWIPTTHFFKDLKDTDLKLQLQKNRHIGTNTLHFSRQSPL